MMELAKRQGVWGPEIYASLPPYKDVLSKDLLHSHVLPRRGFLHGCEPWSLGKGPRQSDGKVMLTRTRRRPLN